MNSKKLVSFVLPIYSEEATIRLLYEELSKIIAEMPQYNAEFVIVDDGSRDKSGEIAVEISKTDPRVKVIAFTRNFGHQAALTAGYDFANGDVIITMDSDMQDAPSLVVDMLKKWEEGNYVVYARRRNRKDPYIRRQVFKAYYWLFDKVSDVKIPRNVGDFRLIDHRVLQHLRECREKYRYLRGMVAWFGFKHAFVDYDRPDREHGESGYTWRKLFKLAVDGFTGFSLFPLKIAAFIGVFVILSGLGFLAYLLVQQFGFGVVYNATRYLVSGVYIFVGIQFILMWLLGEYIGRIHDEQKNRPLYVVDQKYNVTTGKDITSETDFRAQNTPMYVVDEVSNTKPANEDVVSE